MRFAGRNSPFVECVVASLTAPHGPCAHTHMRCQVTSCYRVSSCDRRCCRMNNIQLEINAEAAARDKYVCSQEARVYNSMSVYSCTTKTLQHEPNSKLLENWFKLYNIPFISLSHPCCIITFPPECVEITHFFSPIRSWTTQKELAHFLNSARNDAQLPFMSGPGALLPLTGLNSRTCSS